MTGRTDDVASLRKWQDRIRTEMNSSASAAAGEFHLDPKTLKPLTGKIGVEERRRITPKVSARRERDVMEVTALLAAATKMPQEKHKAPATVSQDIGWYHAEAEKPTLPKAVHAVSAEVKYASAYYETFHCGPFAKTQTVAR